MNSAQSKLSSDKVHMIIIISFIVFLLHLIIIIIITSAKVEVM